MKEGRKEGTLVYYSEEKERTKERKQTKGRKVTSDEREGTGDGEKKHSHKDRNLGDYRSLRQPTVKLALKTTCI